MSEKYGNQGDEIEVGGRNSNQVNKDIRNSEDIIKFTQNCVDKNGEEKFKEDEDENTSDYSDDKNSEVMFSQIINKVILTQELECDEENNGVNKDKSVIFEQTQNITDNTQPLSVDKLIETHRTSTRNKKPPSTRGNEFYGE